MAFFGQVYIHILNNFIQLYFLEKKLNFLNFENYLSDQDPIKGPTVRPKIGDASQIHEVPSSGNPKILSTGVTETSLKIIFIVQCL